MPSTVVKLDAPNVDPLKGTKYDFPRDHVGYGRKSLKVEWPNDAKIAVSFVINYEEGAERTVLNGDSQSESHLWEQCNIPFRVGERAANVESDYDYGSRVGVWRLLDMFEERKMPVTWYAVGQAFEKNPEVARASTQNGHEVASHAYRHVTNQQPSQIQEADEFQRWLDYHAMSPEQEKEFIHRQMESLKQSTGAYPVGWYYGRLSPHSKGLVHEVFDELKTPLLYEADTYADDLPYFVDVPAEKGSASPKGMLMMPYS